jgi:hypothetical protein
MKALVLDAEAVNRLAVANAGHGGGKILNALKGALLAGADVVVPTAVLAELYRGHRYDQRVDSWLGRVGVELEDTTRSLARTVGHLLAGAGLGSAHHVDACVVAVASARGGAKILTGDVTDLAKLSAGMVGIDVESV